MAQAALSGPCYYSGVAAGDMDRDGKLDAAVTCSSGTGTLSLYRGMGDGAFAAPTAYPVFGSGDNLPVLRDMTSDGVLDVAYPVIAGKGLALFVGDGAGGLSYPLYLGDDVHPNALVLEDFDFDGLVDIYAYGRDWGLSLGVR